jgi:hypothetical protein
MLTKIQRSWGLGAVLLILIGMMTGCGFGEPPEQQAANFLASIKPGMTWEQVSAVKAPRKWAVADGEAMGGHKQMQDFNATALADGIKNGNIANGFVFQYRFHEDHAYLVWFDETGKVTEVVKMPSMKDLMT